MYTKHSSAFLMFLFFITIFSSNTVFSQSCKAELKVEKDRNFKSADADGAVFYLTLTNTSSQKDSFFISKNYLSTPCNNTTYKTSLANVEINSTLIANNSKQIANDEIIVLAPGQVYKFQVKVDAPLKKDYHRWSCIEIKASSQNCRNVAPSTVLSVYLSDPSEQ